MKVQQSYVVAGRVALVTAIAVTIICAAVATVFAVGHLVEAMSGRAVVTVPALSTIAPGSIGPDVEWARYAGVTMFVTDTADASAFLTGSALLSLGSILTGGAALVLLCVSLLRTRPFDVSVIVAWFVAAVVTLASGIAGPLMRGRAIERIVQSLPAPAPSDLIGRGDTALYVAHELAALPLLAGGALVLVAVALTVARKLRRDADGIV
ncbi:MULTISPECIES: hypothetical protein [unclassified Rathayibacter]|uniref:hypothetical protein n=1 Tax=unclassified Rathayibacter TaxID=2609250 RepID=UPI00188A7959|nr:MULTISPECIES: hypothetical protein [unclassified Rathayibacter]MBF4463234.1 hypothetical protein [Rathayibacter sp. VKM Ac-2879]MBF4504529.1 hypothetical protein [Rathayibacter sp. VKM Ac-2878]